MLKSIFFAISLFLMMINPVYAIELRDPIFQLHIKNTDNLKQLSNEELKKLYPEPEYKNSKFFKNIKMWIFAEYLDSDGYLYLLIDGAHPFFGDSKVWKGEVEQLGGEIIRVKGSNVKSVATHLSVTYPQVNDKNRETEDYLQRNVVDGLSDSYLDNLLIHLGRDEVRQEINLISDRILGGYVKSPSLYKQMIEKNLISDERVMNLQKYID